MTNLEDELMELKFKFDKMDAMDENDPKFNEDEYNNLEEIIDIKDEQLIDLRRQCSTLHFT